MKVILLKELKGRGGEGDVIDVARGFATNYLFRNGIAIEATPGELKQLEGRRHNIEKRELARTTDANKIKEALDGKTLKVFARVGEEGQLFGSVTATMLADAIAEQIGATVDRKRVELGKPIKEAGKHSFAVSIYRDIKATLEVNVLPEGSELEIVEALEEAAEAVEAEEAEEAAEEVAEEAAEEVAEEAEEAAEEAEEAAEDAAE